MHTELREDIQRSLDKLVNIYQKNSVFTGCSVGVLNGAKGGVSTVFFNYGDTGGSPVVPVDNKTVFDLASLTKPLVTALSILVLVEKGSVRLDDYLSDYIEMVGENTREITIAHLLEHTSGLTAHREFFRVLTPLCQQERERTLFELLYKEELLTKPGREELYSDLGYLILGKLVEKVSGDTLDDFWQMNVIQPLSMEKSLFFAQKEKLNGIVFPTTGSCQWSNKELSGIVHDDNCRIIGGVAGHAGLFGTAEGVLILVETLLKMYEKTYSHPSFTFDLMRTRLQSNHRRWVLGFDTPTGQISSSGKYFSTETIGHLGFTGTSFWLDCKKRIGIVLLTNRVLCNADLSHMRKFRPLVHDLVMEKLTGRQI